MTAAVIIASLVLVVASVAREDSSQLEAGMERSRQQQCGDLLHTPFTLNTGPLEAAREGYCSVPQPRAMLLRTQDHIIDVRGNLAAVNPRARPPACAACSGGGSWSWAGRARASPASATRCWAGGWGPARASSRPPSGWGTGWRPPPRSQHTPAGPGWGWRYSCQRDFARIHSTLPIRFSTKTSLVSKDP